MPALQESPERQRRRERDNILNLISGCEDVFSPRVRKFLRDMASARFVSVKQLEWLRDLKEDFLSL